jgi:hypothetical protein
MESVKTLALRPAEAEQENSSDNKRRRGEFMSY